MPSAVPVVTEAYVEGWPKALILHSPTALSVYVVFSQRNGQERHL